MGHSGTHILIVENDVLLAENLKLNLIREGYSISGVARDMKSALDLMRKRPADLALIDIRLDGPEDGIFTARELYKIKWVPVIYMTGEELKTAAERSKDTYPSAFLEKPISPTELMVQIDIALHNFNAGNIPSANGTDQRPGADHVYVNTQKGQHIRVKTSEILYIQADRIYSKLFLTDDGFKRIFPDKAYHFVHLSMNMGRLLQQLPSAFYKLSRSIVINLDHVERVETDYILLGKKEIAIPEGSKQALLVRLGIQRGR